MKQDKADFDRLKEVRCWLLDMDGTVTLGETALPNAFAFFDAICEQDYLFITNNSSHDKNHYVRRLNRIGFATDAAQILTSTDALIAFLKSKNEPLCVFPVGTPSFEAELSQGGIAITHERDQQIDFVILAFDTTLNYQKLDIACDYIRKGTPYLATNPDRVCPLPDNRVLPDCGALIAYMETCTGRKPVRIVGKPETDLIDLVLAEGSYKRSQLAMVGDRLYTDIEAAKRAGIVSVLVLSGETKREDLTQSEQPDFVFEDIGELASVIRRIGDR